ncbi:Carbonate dehydratase [Bertholletia excelsa]
MAAWSAIFVVAAAFFLLRTVHAGDSSDALFSHSGDTGPDKWGSLSPIYAACSAGGSQSPIDIPTKQVFPNRDLKSLDYEYHPSNSTLACPGYMVVVEFGNDGGELVIDGESYVLKGMHWHTPSEHTIDGVKFDAELHLVHIAEDEGPAVIGILYNIGPAHDPIIAQVQGHLPQLVKNDETIPLGCFDARVLNVETNKYYRYNGSLTTPPCSQTVIWTVLSEVRSVSKEQLEALTAPLQAGSKSNARPVQPLYGRRIEMFSSVCDASNK